MINMNYFNQTLGFLRENAGRLTQIEQFAEETARSAIQDGVTEAQDQLQAAVQEVAGQAQDQLQAAVQEVDVPQVDMARPEREQVQEDDIEFINPSHEEERYITSRLTRALDYLEENRDRLIPETINRITELALARIPDRNQVDMMRVWI